ncbi:MAG: DUF6503 family protein [Candidatus Cyclobacteriaceae bacterium M2_1C_046]
MRIYILLSLSAFLLLGCDQKTEDQEQNQIENDVSSEINILPETVKEAMQAHGSYETWKDYSTLIYTIDTNTITNFFNEKHHIDLDSRKVLIRHDSFKIGYNGEQVWIAPDKEAFGERSPRFYHNLFFYFFSFPFVMADDGVVLEQQGNKTLKGKEYETVRVSYKEGVGDTPEDYYIAYLDPETNQLEWLLYTVTYFSGKAHEDFNALHYADWQKVNGILVPRRMVGYKYAGDSVTNTERYRAVFSDIKFREKDLEDHIFEMPVTAEIDSLPQQ